MTWQISTYLINIVLKSMFIFITNLTTIILSPNSSYAFKDPIDLFIMAGQSHMQGWCGDAAYYPHDPDGLDKKILLYWVTPDFSTSDGKWQNMAPQNGLYPKGHFGPEVTFARELLNSGYNPAILKFSRGGTSLASDWKTPNEEGLYDQMASEFNKAVSLLSKTYSIKVRAFIWLQGESDANESFSHSYYSRLDLLINHIRNELVKNTDLPILLGLDESNKQVKRYPLVLISQKKLAQRKNIRFVSMIGLDKFDQTHLSPEAIQEHGIRLFNVYKSLTQ